MKQLVTSKGLKQIAVLTLLGAVTVFILVERFGYPRQRANMAAADRHLPVLRPMLQKDARFTNITVYTFTGANGSLVVSGLLPSEGDLQALKEFVRASKPPVEVLYHVDVLPSELIEELRKARREDASK